MDGYAISLKRSHQLHDIANYARMEARMELSKQIALKLLMRNEPIDEVVSLTGLSREEVKALLSQLP